jgi:protein-disulfide isomerase
MDQFKADLVIPEVNKKINFDLALGKSAGVSATPSFFLDGTKLSDQAASGIVQGDLTAIKEQLDSLIKQ